MKPGGEAANREDRRTAWRLAWAVAGAFFVLVVVWGVAFQAAAGLDTHRLSREEEKVLLEKRAAEARLGP